MAFKKEIVEIIEPRDIFVGDIDAPVTLMEFGDYESEACAKANEVVKQLLVEYEGKIRFNFRHFPLTRIHQRSLPISNVGLDGQRLLVGARHAPPVLDLVIDVAQRCV